MFHCIEIVINSLCEMLTAVYSMWSFVRTEEWHRCRVLFLIFFWFECKIIPDDYVNAESYAGVFLCSLDIFFTTSFSLSAGPDWSCFLGLYPLGFPRHCPVLVDILLIGLFDGGPFFPLEMGFHWSFCKWFLPVLLITLNFGNRVCSVLTTWELR